MKLTCILVYNLESYEYFRQVFEEQCCQVINYSNN